MAYELLRESPSIRERAAEYFKQSRLLARELGADASKMLLPTRDEFTKHHSTCVKLMLVSMAVKGFPATTWQGLQGKDRHALARGLHNWCILPKVRESSSLVTTAVQYIQIKPRYATADPPGSVVENVDIILGPSDPLVFEKLHALLIDPSAEDKIILEGVKYYLSLVREAGVMPSKTASSPGGRNPNTCQLGVVLQAIGLTRLAYHLPAEKAWKLIHPKQKTEAKGVGINRARKLCRDTMHHHFDLPPDETPIHFRRRTSGTVEARTEPE